MIESNTAPDSEFKARAKMRRDLSICMAYLRYYTGWLQVDLEVQRRALTA
jgi:hypothetical protein